MVTQATNPGARRTASGILSFEEEQFKRGAYSRHDLGLQIVDVARIVGSVGRANDIDDAFNYRLRGGRRRISAQNETRRREYVRALFLADRLPPVDLYKIDVDCFVLDGHRRVSIARELSRPQLEAHVTAYCSDSAAAISVVFYERQAFFAETGLRDVHVTEAGRYPRLVNRIRSYWIESHRERANHVGEDRIAMADEDGFAIREAARHWYRYEYQPIVSVLRAEHVLSQYPGKTLTDLYCYLSDNRWYLSEQQRCDVGWDIALLDFVSRHANSSRTETFVDSLIAAGSAILDPVTRARLGPLTRIASWTPVAFLVGAAVRITAIGSR